MSQTSVSGGAGNSPRRVLFASLIGTTIEYFDFYIYATAAVLVFPQLFFPAGDPASATLQSLATFALAFFARPLGSALFGHFGDRIGRKATLVAALLTMGLSTVFIGLLPTYQSIGVLAPLLLALCRLGQGLGLGGEWGGAVLLATENAPPGKQAWYGMFPQLGAPLGFLCSTGVFLLLSEYLSDAEFFSWGWRVPFVASALLVFVGLYVRLRLHETPAFQRAIDNNERVRVPMLTVCTQHTGTLILGTFAATATFVVFYLMTVFSLSWGTSALGYSRQEFLILQMIGVLFFALTIPLSAVIADRRGRRSMLIAATLGIMAFGLFFAPLFGSDSPLRVVIFLALGLGLMGLTYGPLGTALSELFPTSVRYTGASLTFNLAGILGASLAPYVATWLATNHGLAYVGYYLTAAGAISLLALLLIRRPQPPL
ncbi:MHS family MFS transporter [Steroidobacter sp. S1-65]|uniref:MHS family MFS transporter n=1 Tax=Steroidobacter gossypii TaxID=2805490 RepID=A0ABS1X226_9GAMM|nr:MFS transporter [Steroidobacter gossypii]MBM0107256.1 MHS family MFS transporter [Steroidobacter gossypii]